jgi:hypothetical protein
MPYSVVDKPSKYFNTLTYTATGTGQVVAGNPYKPDFVWLKRRNLTGAHYLYDINRGAQASLQSNSTSAEATSDGYLTSFNSDGWTLGSGNYTSPDTIVGWNWLAANTTVSNTSGTITSTVSANTTAGFSIVSYTGTGANATVGHGLGVAPKIIIVKNRIRSDGSWIVYSSVLGNTNCLGLNLTNGNITDSTVWNNTSPTSTVFTVGTNYQINGSTNTMIAYCFAEIKGYSKFGSYTGNGSDDGTFVYTGFKPAFVLVKRTNSTGYWYLWDSARRTYNYNGLTLFPNDSSAESSYTPSNPVVDFLSNGFKLRGSYPETNASGGTIIYMAFAENPFVSSKGLPCTAR